jgi:hypothetical protein
MLSTFAGGSRFRVLSTLTDDSFRDVGSFDVGIFEAPRTNRCQVPISSLQGSPTGIRESENQSLTAHVRNGERRYLELRGQGPGREEEKQGLGALQTLGEMGAPSRFQFLVQVAKYGSSGSNGTGNSYRV